MPDMFDVYKNGSTEVFGKASQKQINASRGVLSTEPGKKGRGKGATDLSPEEKAAAAKQAEAEAAAAAKLAEANGTPGADPAGVKKKEA